MFISFIVNAETANQNWKFSHEHGVCGLEFYSHPIHGEQKVAINVIVLNSYDLTLFKAKLKHKLEENKQYIFITSVRKDLSSNQPITLEGSSNRIMTIQPKDSIIGQGKVFLLNEQQNKQFIQGLLNEQSFITNVSLESGEATTIIEPSGFVSSYNKYLKCLSAPNKSNHDDQN